MSSLRRRAKMKMNRYPGLGEGIMSAIRPNGGSRRRRVTMTLSKAVMLADTPTMVS